MLLLKANVNLNKGKPKLPDEVRKTGIAWFQKEKKIETKTLIPLTSLEAFELNGIKENISNSSSKKRGVVLRN